MEGNEGRIKGGVVPHLVIMFWSALRAKVFVRVLEKPFHCSLVSVVQAPP
jgi:hypothetical protein